MKLLWLASWYPNRLDLYTGDFIQRHARSVSLYCDVEVIFVKKDPGLLPGTSAVVKSESGALSEQVIYYNPRKINIPLADKILSFLQYKKIYRQAVKQYIQEHGKPSFIHVHVAMNAGLIALWAKRKFKIPYLLTEHWAGYLPAANPNIRDLNFVIRQYHKNVIQNASECSFVSIFLQQVLKQTYRMQNTRVIPNVVDTDVFYPAEKQPSGKLRFIHVSTMLYQKNPEAILYALSLLKEDFDFEMLLYGPVTPDLQQLIKTLGLEEMVLLQGEVPQGELAKAMQQSDALVLYSRFETFGCVLIEANACGIPVIVSNLEVFHEIVEDGVNGIFAAGERPEALAEKLKQFILQKDQFNKKLIAEAARKKYNFQQVGKEFLDWYKNIDN